MKKILSLLAILLLAWCWTQEVVTTEEAPIPEVKETEELPTYYMWDDEAYFWWEIGDWYLIIIPAVAEEQTELISNNQFEPNKVAWQFSKYLVVWFAIDNETSETMTFFTSDMPYVYDNKWRHYQPDVEATADFFVPKAIKWLDAKPWIPTQWFLVYEVAKDSTWFYFQEQGQKIILQERE